MLGDRVEVKCKGRDSQRGILTEVNPRTVALRVGGSDVYIPSSQILSIKPIR